MPKRYEVQGEGTEKFVSWEGTNVSVAELLDAAAMEFRDVPFESLEIGPGEECLFLQHKEESEPYEIDEEHRANLNNFTRQAYERLLAKGLIDKIKESGQ